MAEPKLSGSDHQLLAELRDMGQTYGINAFALIGIIARYKDTLRADIQMLGPAKELYADIVALQAKYKPLIDRFMANLPQNQKMVDEIITAMS